MTGRVSSHEENLCHFLPKVLFSKKKTMRKQVTPESQGKTAVKMNADSNH